MLMLGCEFRLENYDSGTVINYGNIDQLAKWQGNLFKSIIIKLLLGALLLNTIDKQWIKDWRHYLVCSKNRK